MRCVVVHSYDVSLWVKNVYGARRSRSTLALSGGVILKFLRDQLREESYIAWGLATGRKNRVSREPDRAVRSTTIKQIRDWWGRPD